MLQKLEFPGAAFVSYQQATNRDKKNKNIPIFYTSIFFSVSSEFGTVS
jgi:hypothetical protein